MSERLAIEGGAAIRQTPLPYAQQSIDDADVAAVTEVLRSGWLTTGPSVSKFEQQFASFVTVRHAVAVNSGTAALHAAMFALQVGPGDEVIVPAMTFAATANAVLFQNAAPVIVDVDAETLLIDPQAVERAVTRRTKAIIAVDFAGDPSPYDELRTVANKHGITLIADACHALGAIYKDCPVGSLADISTFSFHPAKHITTGEGGMAVTDDDELAHRMRRFRNHCISADPKERAKKRSWRYDVVDLGFNYRLSDLQCALGVAQLQRLPASLDRRRAIARMYDAAFAEMNGLRTPPTRKDCIHAYHLYVIQLELDRLAVDREAVYAAMHAEGIAVNVHYIPLHHHTLYQTRLGVGVGDFPNADRAYERILTLPMFPKMTDKDVDDVIEAVRKVLGAYRRDA